MEEGTDLSYNLKKNGNTDWWLIRKKIPLLIEQAKKMEKQQIQDAYLDGYCETAEDSQDYYDKNFNK